MLGNHMGCKEILTYPYGIIRIFSKSGDAKDTQSMVGDTQRIKCFSPRILSLSLRILRDTCP